MLTHYFNFFFILHDLHKMYYRFYKLMSLLDHVILLIIHAGFYYIIRLQYIKMDHDLLSALIERWR